jgi:hypothetical protein
MTPKLLALLALLAASPHSGDVEKAQTFQLWVSPSAQQAFLASGQTLTMSGSGNYATVTARSWYFTDGGLDVGPTFPAGTVILGATGPAVCASLAYCVAFDGGVDPVVNTAPACSCAVDAAAVYPDGGPALHGVTLQPGVASGNLVTKSCVDLFTYLPDGGPDTSWPAACPLL